MATIDLGKIKFNWRGTYAGGTAYVPDDVVYYMDGSVGSSYMCVANTTGNAPSSGGTLHASWQYLAKGQASSPTTTQGDIIVRGASADARLAIGTAGQFVKVNSGANGLEYGSVSDPRTVSAVTDTSTGSQYYAFTGIDTTILRFDVIFRSYSNNGNNEIQLQLGNSSGYATSGYNGGAGYWRDSTSTKEQKTSAFESSGLAGSSYYTTGKWECTKIHTGASTRWFCNALFYTTAANDHVFYYCGYKDIQDLNSVRFGGQAGTGDSGHVQLVTYSG